MAPDLCNIPAAMKSKCFILTLLLALCGAFAVPAMADDTAKEPKAPSKTALKKYDKDKDGMLNAEEQAAQDADKAKDKEKRAEKKKAKEQAAADSAK